MLAFATYTQKYLPTIRKFLKVIKYPQPLIVQQLKFLSGNYLLLQKVQEIAVPMTCLGLAEEGDNHTSNVPIDNQIKSVIKKIVLWMITSLEF